MRTYGTGSVYPRGRRWAGSYSDIHGVRHYVSALTEHEVTAMVEARTTLSRRPRHNDRLFAHTRRKRAVTWTAFLLEEAASEGWAAEFTAKVIVAQLAPRRVRLGIFGPCEYCGSWIAGTVDHVTPTVLGGTNDRDNLVSACLRCNSVKGPRALAAWVA